MGVGVGGAHGSVPLRTACKGGSRNIERGELKTGSGGSAPGKILSIEFLVSILFFHTFER